MYSLNRAEIIGNLTRDPEMRYTPNGQAVCSFGVATNRRWRDKDGNNQESTEFHNVVAWGKLAEFVSQFMHKGNKMYVEGRLQTRTWEGQDGARRNRTEIVLDNFVPLTPKGSSPAGPVIPENIEEFPPSDAKTEEPKPGRKIAKKPEEESEEEKKDVKKDDRKPDNETNFDDIDLDKIPF